MKSLKEQFIVAVVGEAVERAAAGRAFYDLSALTFTNETIQ